MTKANSVQVYAWSSKLYFISEKKFSQPWCQNCYVNKSTHAIKSNITIFFLFSSLLAWFPLVFIILLQLIPFQHSNLQSHYELV